VTTTATTETTETTTATLPVTDPATAPFTRVAPRVEGDPVVVVGAGPVGQTTALLLARWGVDVILLDAKPARDPIGSKAICQARDVLDVWESVGAGAYLASQGVTWTTARTYYQDREITSWRFVDAGASPLPPYVNIGQERSEAVLDQRIAAANRSGASIDVRWGHELLAVDQNAGGVALRVRTPDGETTIRTPHAVVTTGARSDDLRAAFGFGFDGQSFDDLFLICDIRTELPGWEHERRFYFDPPWNPGRQILIHPTPDSVYRIDWQVPDGYDLEQDEASGGLDRRIRQIIGDRDYEIVWKSVYRFHSRHTERMRLGRVLLAGDCAHLVSPFGARGLNTGVLDADNAAWKIAFVLHGWAPEDLLESYDAERMAATRENIEVTTATMNFLVPHDEAGRAHRRELLEKAAVDPEAARRIDSGRFAEPFWYVESPLTTPDPDRPFAGRPPKGQAPPPAPGTILPDMPVSVPDRPEVTRLRDIAREGLLVLTGDAVDPQAITAALADVAAPVAVRAVSAIEATGRLAEVLALRDDEAWVIRPDAHVAAVVRGTPFDAAALHRAVRTALGHDIGARHGVPAPTP
jgi:pentachlorophenol monooxygenase/3-(3-hydroxy-phenyl)propionate hydroxylase